MSQGALAGFLGLKLAAPMAWRQALRGFHAWSLHAAENGSHHLLELTFSSLKVSSSPVLNVVTFMQFLCRSQRLSLRADCGISQVL